MEKNINIPKGWKELGDIAQICTGKKDANFGGQEGIYPFFTCAAEPIKCNSYSFDCKAILMAGNGDIRNISLYNGKFEAYQRTYVVVIDETINIEYVYYYLKYKWFDFNKDKMYGSTIQYIRLGNLKQFPIPLMYDYDTQSAIVSHIESQFSRLDSGIAALQKVQKQLAVYRQAVLKEAFEGCGEKKMSIKDLCHSLKYGTAKKSEKQGKVIVLRMGNMQNGIIMWDDLAYTNDDDDIKKYGLQKGDVLFNRTNSPEWVGKTSIYKGEYPAIYAGYLIKLDYKHDLVLGEYLTYYLNTPMARAYCNSVKTDGVNQSNINAQKIGAFEIPVPDLSVQSRIVEHIESRLSVCDSIEKTVSESLRQAEVLRQSILKEAFEGRL